MAKLPKDIVEKMEQVNKLTEEISKWFYDNDMDLEGTEHENTDYHGKFRHRDYYEFTDTPTGTEQRDGEYCEQHQDVMIEDSYYGKYYYPTEKGNYFKVDFEV